MRIDGIDKDQKRISLSIPEAEARDDKTRKSEKESVEDFREYVDKAQTSMGSFGDIMKRKLGKKKENDT